MIWRIVSRIGEKDTYHPPGGRSRRDLLFVIDAPAGPTTIANNLRDVLRGAGLRPPPPAVDLVHLAMTVYSADRRVPRISAYNRWERGLQVFLPVSDLAAWQPLTQSVETMLRFLTNDHWELHFRQAESTAPSGGIQGRLDGCDPELGPVALLSGGLDSLVGAVNLLEETRGRLAFASHHNSGSITRQVQNRVYALLSEYYPDRFEQLRFFVQPPRILNGRVDSTSRSRSLLFLSLGVCTAGALAQATGLYLTENGFMSLNVPLDTTRVGSLSTRATHPYLLAQLRAILSALGLQVPMHNQAEFQTKGEMLADCKNPQVIRRGIDLTMSCSHTAGDRFNGVSPYTHCGRCIGCIVRRAATHKAGLPDTAYAVDVLRDPQADDLRALKAAMKRLEASDKSTIFDVVRAGPLANALPAYADVYKRGLVEIKDFLSQSSIRQ